MKKLIFAIACAVLASACGNNNAVTQYVVNLDSQSSISKGGSGTCDAATPDANATVTTSDFKSGAVMTLWQEADGTAFAELGGHVFTGTVAKDTYSLTDVQSTHDTSQDNIDRTDSDTFTLSITLTGNFVTGSITEEKISTCAGTECGEFTNTDCITKNDLRGQELATDGSEAQLPSP